MAAPHCAIVGADSRPDVRDTETPADRQLLDIRLAHEGRHRRQGLSEGRDVEHLAPHMRVDRR